ncbi:S-formylglutathione hydrolase [Clostridium perfringens]|uniref:S-formylglutathione hydrolase n=1 Tax=Clostridium perfringens TaxID=1502 RepID=UPI000B369DEF|nr:S-formylglutathione hydrolase [Clostridium perfringens]OUN49916.1 S-formylglutathione hydrolase [Clostridium perfringens]OUP41758.1 S-formylglutathione hydrolase [Clostridium perfringens]
MSLKLIEKHLSFEGEQCKYRHYSEVLKCDMNFSVYLPSNKEDKEVPIIWWLSGLTCTDDNFSQKSGFQRLANKHQVAVIIPDTSPRGEDVADDEAWDLGQGAGFYLNAVKDPWGKNYKMYNYIVEELSTISRKIVPKFSGKESIMGHSMGGHGALIIGMKNSSRFQSISAFSPILSPSKTPWGIKAFTAYLGEDESNWKEWDASELLNQDVELPPILIHQGDNDDFYEKQLQENLFIRNANKNRRVVDYNKVEGYDHSYFFIATFLEEHFAFHMKYLR